MFIKVENSAVTGSPLNKLPQAHKNIGNFRNANKSMQIANGFYELIKANTLGLFEEIQGFTDAIDNIAGTVTRTYTVVKQDLQQLKDQQIAKLSKVTEQRIIGTQNIHDQINMLIRQQELKEIEAGPGRPLTAEERTEQTTIKSEQGKIKALRAKYATAKAAINAKTTHQEIIDITPETIFT